MAPDSGKDEEEAEGAQVNFAIVPCLLYENTLTKYSNHFFLPAIMPWFVFARSLRKPPPQAVDVIVGSPPPLTFGRGRFLPNVVLRAACALGSTPPSFAFTIIGVPSGCMTLKSVSLLQRFAKSPFSPAS